MQDTDPSEKVVTLRRRKSSDGLKTTAATNVYDRLRSDILAGRLEPGSKLRIEFVCERYAAGGSPVREALNRLSAEGFVEREDQRGFFVAPVSLDHLRELVRTRCWLEGRAVIEAIANRSEEWEEGLVLAYHRLSRVPRSAAEDRFEVNPDWERHHHAFHHALIATCGSSILLRYCTELRDQSDRYRVVAAASIYPRRNDRDEHHELMEAALDGRSDDAAEGLVRHYNRTLTILEAYFGGGREATGA